MPSEPLIALALSLLISLAPFLPTAAEKSAPEEEPARVVEEQPALSAEQLAALAQTTQNELGDVATAQRQRLHRRSQHVALRLHRREREALPRG